MFVYRWKVMNNLPQVTKLWIYQETNSQRHVWALSLQKENFQNYISFSSSDSITCRRRFARITTVTWGAEGYKPRTMVRLLNTAPEKASLPNLSNSFFFKQYKITNCPSNRIISRNIYNLIARYMYSTLCSWKIKLLVAHYSS